MGGRKKKNKLGPLDGVFWLAWRGSWTALTAGLQVEEDGRVGGTGRLDFKLFYLHMVHKLAFCQSTTYSPLLISGKCFRCGLLAKATGH